MNQRNVFQMYVDNGCRAGFWVRRLTWGNTVALVVSIDGKSSGELAGRAPYFGNPRVTAEFYQRERHEENWRKVEGLGADADLLRCPGTYQYVQIDPPR